MMKNPNFLKISLSTLALSAMSVPLLTQAYTLTRQLEVGSVGEDVSAVQTFLAADVTLYPERLVTGYYGLLTQGAVTRFQVRNGIPAVGRIGPITLPIINAQMNANALDKSAPSIYSLGVNPSRTEASFSWSTSENASAIIYYSTSPIAMTEAGPGTAVTIYGTSLLVHSDLRTAHSANLNGLQPNTTYYYVVYVRDSFGNESITWPNTFHTNS